MRASRARTVYFSGAKITFLFGSTNFFQSKNLPILIFYKEEQKSATDLATNSKINRNRFGNFRINAYLCNNQI